MKRLVLFSSIVITGNFSLIAQVEILLRVEE